MEKGKNIAMSDVYTIYTNHLSLALAHNMYIDKYGFTCTLESEYMNSVWTTTKKANKQALSSNDTNLTKQKS